ncbi:hypothetical protein ACJMK2_029088 [Sinanodonta woodiana]|uniref:Periodic tryptophan protein 1 n=1 Tax=Sinanodonta woodiana TaxID=1069815 RepID=A0ABD3XAX7_SINWO
MNIVPCVKWIRRGVSKSVPDRVKLDKDELKRIIEETEERLEEGENEDEEEQEEDGELDEEHGYVKSEKGATAAVNQSDTVKKAKKRKTIENEEDIVKKYGLEEYDEEEAPNPLKGIGNLTYYADEEDDPYITLKGEMDSDEEDFEIKPTDNLILVARAEKDACTLEVHVYNEDLVNLYVHHDIILPSFPLALEWLNYDIADGRAGNFVAVGSMEPTIDIWDIDLVDSLEPVATLGTRQSKKKKKKGTLGHTDAVLDLSWNPNVRHALASASADCVVGLWDLSEGKMVKSIKKHEDKVQCVRWHPFEPQSLLSGSFDHTVNVFDCRSPDTSFKTWTFEGEVERVVWDHFSPFNFYATTDNGHLYYLDSRQDKPVFTLSAHNEAVTGISLSSHIPGLLVTTSSDRKFKVWDVMDNKPSLILEKDFKMGQLYCVDGCQEAPFVFAFGGEKDVKVWDVRDSAAVLNHFKSRAPVKFSVSDGAVTETSIAMDTGEDSAVAMETLSIDNTDEANQKEKKKKKKKKKRKQKIICE